MVNPWILVTPASRGIGFELARRLLQTTKLPVVATSRSGQDETKSRLLDGLDVESSRLDVLQLDVKDESTISSAASFCSDKFQSPSSYLHLAFCVPGILYPEKSPAQIDASQALETFQINTLGPMLVAKHFTPLMPGRRTELLSTSSSSSSSLPRLATFALMAARVGSTSDNRAGGWYSYRASKAGAMQVARTLDLHLRMASGGRAIGVGLHPGTVKTGLSRRFWDSVPKDKLFEAPFAAERLVDVVSRLDEQAGGRTWDWKGEEVLP